MSGLKDTISAVFKQAPGRIPPQALDAEQAVLGALLLESSGADRLPSSLKGECFYKEANKVLFESIKDLYQNREPIDLITVKNHLSLSGKLGLVGGIFYLTELSSNVSSAVNIEHHCMIIMQKYMLREIIKLGDKMVADGYNEMTDPFIALNDIRKSIDEIEPSHEGGTSLIDAVSQSESDIERAMKGDYTSIPAGYSSMDGVKYESGEVLVIGGDTGAGKTAFAFGFAMGLNKLGYPVFYNSLEMKPKDLAKRVMASYASKKIWHIRTGKMESNDWESWQHMKNQKRFEIMSCRTSDALFSAIRKFRKKYNIKDSEPVLIVNDYIQLMTGVGGTTEERVTQLSNSMKEFAMDSNALVINLSQLNRASLNNDRKKPSKEGLKYASTLEADADYIYLLYRPEYYGLPDFEDGSSSTGKGELIEAKMRNGFTRPFNDQLKFAFVNGLWMPEDEVGKYFGSPQQALFPDFVKPPNRISESEFSDNIEKFNSGF